MTKYKIIIVEPKELEQIYVFEYKTSKEYFKNLNIYLSASFEIFGKEYHQSFASHMTIEGNKQFPTLEITSIFVE